MSQAVYILGEGKTQLSLEEGSKNLWPFFFWHGWRIPLWVAGVLNLVCVCVCVCVFNTPKT